MKVEEITNGCLVIIKHSQEGGEVIETNRPDGRFLIKVARMKVKTTGIKTQIVNVLADAEDLEPTLLVGIGYIAFSSKTLQNFLND